MLIVEHQQCINVKPLSAYISEICLKLPSFVSFEIHYQYKTPQTIPNQRTLKDLKV